MKRSLKHPCALVSATIVALALATPGCGGKPEGRAKSAGGMVPVPVQVAVAVQKDVPRIIDSIGAMQPLRSVAVKSQVDGVIATIHFREGQEIKAGNLLVTLDKRPFENGLRMANADLTNARAEAMRADDDVKRYQRLGQEQAISKEQLAQLVTKAETTRAIVTAKEAAVANAELMLGYAEIRAPITGRTGQLLLHEGALVKANDVNQSIVTINQITPIAATYSVPEPSLGDVRAALAAGTVVVSVLDRSGAVSKTGGKLAFVDNTVDSSTGTITLKAIFDNADHALWPGQFVHVQTQVGVDEGAIVVPTSAVMTGQNGSQVFVVGADETAQLRAVTVARAVGDSTVLSAGVKPGELIVIDGQLRLLPGAKIVQRDIGQAAAAVTTATTTP